MSSTSKARSASGAAMIPPDALAPLAHGGDLDAARKLFPGAPEPFLDLSTGINPFAYPYPIRDLLQDDFARLPEPADLKRLTECAATVYAAPSEENVVPGPGGQALTTLSALLVPPGRAAVVGPTYAEHARTASLAGHEVTTVSDLAPLGDADLAVVVNPNNPDGRIFGREELLQVAEKQRGHGGLLIVDEAFMDAGPRNESLSLRVNDANVIVLRSFGKFFGLAGVRLSFALAPCGFAASLRASLGPWPVSGPALRVGLEALQNWDCIREIRVSLAKAARRLEDVLGSAGLEIVGGTELFCLVRSPDAEALFEQLGRAGIFVRRFAEEPSWLRFGLPGPEGHWRRLEAALKR
jgi:cobalamin biosynthetic protein CobC